MGWWKYAYVGQKVVCVEANELVNDPEAKDCNHAAVVGGIYTISKILPICNWPVRVQKRVSSGLAIRLVEDMEWYNPAKFRPAQTKSTETGMKMIRKLLDSVPVKEDA